MYQPEQRVIHLRATQPNHKWVMEMMTDRQIHHRDGRKWIVIQETLKQHGLHVTIQELIFVQLSKETEGKTMTTEIEKTKRALYGCLDRIRRAGKHRKLTAEFEERLEEHLEALRQEAGREYQLRRSAMQRIEEHVEKFSKLLEERDQIQQRLHAIDHAYNEQQKAIGIAGEELIRVQGIARQHLDDVSHATKQIDDLHSSLVHSDTVIGRQEQLIVGQRLAIADLYLAGRRVNSAVATLQRLGYTDCGGQLWKPPLGKKPDFGSVGSPSGSGDTCWRCGTPQ